MIGDWARAGPQKAKQRAATTIGIGAIKGRARRGGAARRRTRAIDILIAHIPPIIDPPRNAWSSFEGSGRRPLTILPGQANHDHWRKWGRAAAGDDGRHDATRRTCGNAF